MASAEDELFLDDREEYEDDAEEEIDEPRAPTIIGDDEEDEIVADDPQASSSSLVGKDGHQWSAMPLERKGAAAPRQFILYPPSTRGDIKKAKTPLETWEFLINTTILEKILKHTNENIRQTTVNIAKKQSYHTETTMTELRALIGLLYLAGALKSARVDTEELWSHRYGVPVFRATMPERRFNFLLPRVRFDDKNTRDTRRYTDNFAPIREIWELFIANCTRYYNPFTNVTIDEQLLDFRGNCPFQIYIPSKPAKYGIKVIMCNDAKTFYMISAIPYVGPSQKKKDDEAAMKAKREQKKREKKPAKSPVLSKKAKPPPSKPKPQSLILLMYFCINKKKLGNL